MVRGARTAMKSGPNLPQLEKALAQRRRPNTAINKLKKKNRWDRSFEAIHKIQISWRKILTNLLHKNFKLGTSLVAQWLRIHLPVQVTRVPVLVREDPTCCGATRPVCHNYWASALEPASHNYWAHVPQLLKPARLEPVLCNKRSHCDEKPAHHNEEWPPLAATRESLHSATKTQRSQK